MDEPRRTARAAGDDAFRATPFRRDVRKLLWTARFATVTVALELQRSPYGPKFYVNVGAHLDGIVQPVVFDPRDISTFVLYTRLAVRVRAFDESVLDFQREMPEGERRRAIGDALREHALPLLDRLSNEDGIRAFAAEQPADDGSGQRLRWLLGIGPRPDWMEWNPP